MVRSRTGRRKRPLYLHLYRFTHSFHLYIIALVVLLIIHDLLTASGSADPDPYALPSSPGSFEGKPASLLSPATYFSSGARFLFYSGYGQFNNQLVSLINALFIARRADAILVLPYVKLGKESRWDIKHRNLSTELFSTRQLVGHYFNYTHLLKSSHVVLPHTFFTSPDGVELLNRPNVTVGYRSGAYVHRVFNFASQQYLHRNASRVYVHAPQHPKAKLRHVCDMNPHHALATINHLGRNDRFIFLPVVFRRHNLNCTLEEPNWVSIRSSLVPRDEFLHAVDSFIDTLPKPLFSIHLRLFLNGDLGNFTPHSFVSMLFQDFENQLFRARTIFVAYSPSSDESRQIFSLLKAQFPGLVVDGSNSASYFRSQDTEFANMALSAVLFDMWVCVKSDIFLGRLGSSLSWNTAYWRQALWSEYRLDENSVHTPLWYELSNFTTTGLHRKEGPLHGVRYITE